jgi:hypothetical protein
MLRSCDTNVLKVGPITEVRWCLRVNIRKGLSSKLYKMKCKDYTFRFHVPDAKGHQIRSITVYIKHGTIEFCFSTGAGATVSNWGSQCHKRPRAL